MIFRQPYKTTCEASLSWYYPTVDLQLITGYFVRRMARRNGLWIWENTTSVGNTTQYRTNCVLQPGRLYSFEVGSNLSLSNLDVQIMNVYNRQLIIMGMYLEISDLQ